MSLNQFNHHVSLVYGVNQRYFINLLKHVFSYMFQTRHLSACLSLIKSNHKITVVRHCTLIRLYRRLLFHLGQYQLGILLYFGTYFKAFQVTKVRH